MRVHAFDVGKVLPLPVPLPHPLPHPHPFIGRGEVSLRNAFQDKIQFARRLRRDATPAEEKAWDLLRNRRMLGLKFRRQHPICGFVADFFCHRLRLVLEIDGSYHHQPHQVTYDQRRTAILEAHGFRVLRIANEDVSKATLLRLLSPLSSLRGEGDRG